MSRRRLVLALVVLLTVAGLGLAATTVDITQPSPGGADVGQPVADGSGQSSGGSGLSLIVVVLAVLAIASVVYTVYKNSLPTGLTLLFVACVLLVLLVIAGTQYLPGATERDPGPLAEDRDAATPVPVEAGTPGPGGGGAVDGGPVAPTGALAILVAALLAGGLAVVYFTGESEAASEADAETGDTQQAVGEAAGRAADELAESTLSNAVFRAWQEMTDALDVQNPETTTPAEFEEVAVEAGLDRADVATLTDLFREVRYGGAEATADREERARETLRRIEATYADDWSDDAADPDGEES